tara:strand:- start:88 stop:1836 length:1749 start_codon:yes stop_codon:yes gene_type:complete
MIRTIKQKFIEIDFLLTRKLKFLYILNFFMGLFGGFFEVIGIGSIVVFIGAIVEPENFFSGYEHIYAVNYFINIDDKHKILFLSLSLIGIFLTKAIVIFFQQYIQSKFNFETLSHISYKLLKSYLFKEYTFHLKNNSSDLNQRIINESNQAVMYLEWFQRFLNTLFLILGILFLLSYSSSVVGILNVSVVFIIVFISKYFLTNRIKNRAKIRSDNDLVVFKTIQHAFGSYIETVLFKKENFFLNHFKKHFRTREFQTFVVTVLSALPKIFIEVIVVVALSFFFVFYIESSEDLIKKLPFLSLIVVSFIRLMPTLNQFLLSINQLKFLTYGKNIIVNELKKIEGNKINKTLDSSKTDINFNQTIKIENLSFKYEDSSKNYVFENLSLKINLGDKIAIVGESGIGKSTLINLLTGLLKPSKGKILVDGLSIFENIKKWQKIISYIPQDIYLIDDTIEKNITFSTQEEEVDKEFLDKILKLSNIYNDVYKLKDGTQTLVGNKGIRFSGGQRQRIAIARALYKKPKILIMDEPTSGLDFENEVKLIENILEISKDITLIIISHNIDRYKDKFDVYELKNNLLIKGK